MYKSYLWDIYGCVCVCVCNSIALSVNGASWLQIFHPCTYSIMYLPTLPLGQDVTQGQFLTGLNSEFPFSYTGCHTKVIVPSLLFYLALS